MHLLRSLRFNLALSTRPYGLDSFLDRAENISGSWQGTPLLTEQRSRCVGKGILLVLSLAIQEDFCSVPDVVQTVVETHCCKLINPHSCMPDQLIATFPCVTHIMCMRGQHKLLSDKLSASILCANRAGA